MRKRAIQALSAHMPILNHHIPLHNHQLYIYVLHVPLLPIFSSPSSSPSSLHPSLSWTLFLSFGIYLFSLFSLFFVMFLVFLLSFSSTYKSLYSLGILGIVSSSSKRQWRFICLNPSFFILIYFLFLYTTNNLFRYFNLIAS